MDDYPKISPELIDALLNQYYVKVAGGVKKDGSIAGIVTLAAQDFIEPMENGIQKALELIKEYNPGFEVDYVDSENPCLWNERLRFQFRDPAAYVEV